MPALHLARPPGGTPNCSPLCHNTLQVITYTRAYNVAPSSIIFNYSYLSSNIAHVVVTLEPSHEVCSWLFAHAGAGASNALCALCTTTQHLILGKAST